MLNHIIENERDKWKKDTFERIKSKLLSVKGNRFVQYNRATQTHFVCVYGKSQIGKTTLILNMIGVKDKECENVSKVLRGGIAPGNSSTSTAIIYSRSDCNKYGVSFETLSGQKTNDTIEYFTPDGMIRKLQSIRNLVESNQLSSTEILRIFIPNEYFAEFAAESKISIIDLPGIESRNPKEKAHVESLCNRYVPISSVCIIATLVNEITDLEKEELPFTADWRNLSHKFVVVTTKSYSVGTIKDYFKTPRDNRKESFKDFVNKKCKEDSSKYLGKSNTIQIFPLEMGQSFGTLLTEELSNDKDCEEVKETRDCILSKLQDFIIEQKGEQLLSVIQELRCIVENTKNDSIKKLSDQKEEKKQELVNSKNQLKRFEDELNFINGIEESEEKIRELKDLKEKVEQLPNQVTVIMKSLIESVKQEIKKEDLSENGYLKDSEKKVWKCIRIKLSALLDKEIFSVINNWSLRSQYDIAFDLYKDTISNRIFQDFANKFEKKLYPDIGIFERIGNSIRNLITYKGTVKLDDALSYIRQLEQIICMKLNEEVIKPIKAGIDTKKKEITNEINFHKSLQNKKTEEIETKKENIKEIESGINEIDESIKFTKEQIERDQETLRTYLRFAEEAYLCQRDEIIAKINSAISSSEKFLYLLLLNIIDKDYNVLKNISDE